MSTGTLLLAWRYLLFHRGKSLIVGTCLTIAFFLPLAVHRLAGFYDAHLSARARSTPLLLGAKGNRYDLLLRSLYFRSEYGDGISMADVDSIEQEGFGEAIPLHLRHRAHRLYEEGEAIGRLERAPVVGTTLAYFAFRELVPAHGSLPAILGEAVVGAEVAERLDLRAGDNRAGDNLVSDPTGFYNLAEGYQLKLSVVGVLARTGTADDLAVFVDIKTTWVIDGVGHGHVDLTRGATDPALVDRARSSEQNVTGTARVVPYQEITAANLETFHFHGERAGFPVTSAIVIPRDEKQRTILGGRFAVSETRQLLVPEEVAGELMAIVFEVKRFFDANFALVTVAIALFTGLVIALSLRLRAREMDTLFRLGCARATIFWLQTYEVLILVGASAVLAAAGSQGMLLLAPRLLEAVL
jgi:putative ABC transport system permease protein